jgi:ankyrin repeat protein
MPAVQQLDLKTSGGPKYNDLMTAVLYKDAAGVNELLVFGKWPDKPDSRGMTPLMAAALLGDLGNAESLLKAGAEPSRAMALARDRGDGAMMTLLEKYSRR